MHLCKNDYTILQSRLESAQDLNFKLGIQTKVQLCTVVHLTKRVYEQVPAFSDVCQKLLRVHTYL